MNCKHHGFIQALLLTSVFHEGLSFLAVDHNPTCGSMLAPLALAAGGSRGHCKSPFGYFSNPRCLATQNSKSCEHITMLKQGIKTSNFEFIQTHALSQLSFTQFIPYATLFIGPLSLTLMLKSKKTLETCLDLMLSFKTSVDH